VSRDQDFAGPTGDRRRNLLVTGTSLAALLSPGHPWRGKLSRPELLRRFVFGEERTYNAATRAMFRAGTEGEEVAIAWLERALDRPIYRPGLMEVGESPWWGGCCDGLALGPTFNGVTDVDFLVEVKTLVSRPWRWNADGSAEVPSYYVAQAQWYMWAVGAPKCCFLQYKPPAEGELPRFEITWVRADTEEMNTLLRGLRADTAAIVTLRALWAGLGAPADGPILDRWAAVQHRKEDLAPEHWAMLEEGVREATARLKRRREAPAWAGVDLPPLPD